MYYCNAKLCIIDIIVHVTSVLGLQCYLLLVKYYWYMLVHIIYPDIFIFSLYYYLIYIIL